MASAQVNRNYRHLLRCDLGLQQRPVILREPGQPIYTFNQQHVTFMAVIQQAEQLRTVQLGSTHVLDVEGRDLMSTLGGEVDQRLLRSSCVLLGSRSSEVGADEHGRTSMCHLG
ncbi:hypothetical protein D3C77_598110 [compost metagenome]